MTDVRFLWPIKNQHSFSWQDNGCNNHRADRDVIEKNVANRARASVRVSGARGCVLFSMPLMFA